MCFSITASQWYCASVLNHQPVGHESESQKHDVKSNATTQENESIRWEHIMTDTVTSPARIASLPDAQGVYTGAKNYSLATRDTLAFTLYSVESIQGEAKIFSGNFKGAARTILATPYK
jgi:hypothetical protein